MECTDDDEPRKTSSLLREIWNLRMDVVGLSPRYWRNSRQLRWFKCVHQSQRKLSMHFMNSCIKGRKALGKANLRYNGRFHFRGRTLVAALETMKVVNDWQNSVIRMLAMSGISRDISKVNKFLRCRSLKSIKFLYFLLNKTKFPKLFSLLVT